MLRGKKHQLRNLHPPNLFFKAEGEIKISFQCLSNKHDFLPVFPIPINDYSLAQMLRDETLASTLISFINMLNPM